MVYRFYVQSEQIIDGRILISGVDVNHIKNVLRMKLGETLIICDGKGMDYHCEIISLGKEEIWVKEISHSLTDTELPVKITLFQGIPKKDKMELIIQKTVELGVTEVVPVTMKRCVAKLEDEKKERKKRERWQMIAEAAAKQSRRGILPIVKPSMTYIQALEWAKKMNMVLIPYEHELGMKHTKEVFQKMVSLIDAKKDSSVSPYSNLPNISIGIFIGPEGGFELEEIETARKAGAEIISLGKRILRTETAGLSVFSILMYELECNIEK